jgi:hypothetical protein
MEPTYRTGQFIWRELICPDVAKAKGFYGELFGWTFRDSDMGSFVYSVAQVGERGVAGFMPLSAMPQPAPPPCWTSYVSAADVDATVALAEQNGGFAPMKPQSIPGVGRFAMIGDPTGGFLGLMHGESGDMPAQMPPPLGTFCWETLNTTDVEKAKAFYTKVIGWTITGGPGNNMAVFQAGEAQVADAEAAPPGVPSHWLAHVVVEKLEPAREKAERLGAKIMMPVIDIPQVGRIAIIMDPFGAALSLFEPGPMPAA